MYFYVFLASVPLVFCRLVPQNATAAAQNCDAKTLTRIVWAINMSLEFEASQSEKLTSDARLNLKQVAMVLEEAYQAAKWQNSPVVAPNDIKDLANLAANLSKLPLITATDPPQNGQGASSNDSNRLPETIVYEPPTNVRNKRLTPQLQNQTGVTKPRQQNQTGVTKPGQQTPTQPPPQQNQQMEKVQCGNGTAKNRSYVVGNNCTSSIMNAASTPNGLCNLTETCIVYILGVNSTTGESPVGRIQVLQRAEMLGCLPAMDAFNSNGMYALKNVLCAEAFKKANDIAKLGYPVQSQRIFMTAVATCGVYGYAEFLQKEWINQILKWQGPDGGFESQNCSDTIEPTNIKRSMRAIPTNSNNMTMTTQGIRPSTSQALMALSANLRSCLKSSTLNKTVQPTTQPISTIISPNTSVASISLASSSLIFHLTTLVLSTLSPTLAL